MHRVTCSQIYAQAITVAAFEALTNSINALYTEVGILERIADTPLSFAYVHYIRSGILVYLIFELLFVCPPWGWHTIATMGVTSWILLALEATATECERPVHRRLNHLPLAQFCCDVADNVQQTASLGPLVRDDAGEGTGSPGERAQAQGPETEAQNAPSTPNPVACAQEECAPLLVQPSEKSPLLQ